MRKKKTEPIEPETSEVTVSVTRRKSINNLDCRVDFENGRLDEVSFTLKETSYYLVYRNLLRIKDHQQLIELKSLVDWALRQSGEEE